MGPLLLSQLLELSEAQEGILNIAFRLADEQGLALLDIKDIQSLLVWLGENRQELSLRTEIYRFNPLEPFNAGFWCLRTKAQPKCLVNLLLI